MFNLFSLFDVSIMFGVTTMALGYVVIGLVKGFGGNDKMAKRVL